MGGENSEIVSDTVDVVFESACFDGTCIRKGALALGMRTEASAKFEKGLDPLNTLPAVNRACELVEMLGAGEVLDLSLIHICYGSKSARLDFVGRECGWYRGRFAFRPWLKGDGGLFCCSPLGNSS